MWLLIAIHQAARIDSFNGKPKATEFRVDAIRLGGSGRLRLDVKRVRALILAAWCIIQNESAISARESVILTIVATVIVSVIDISAPYDEPTSLCEL